MLRNTQLFTTVIVMFSAYAYSAEPNSEDQFSPPFVTLRCQNSFMIPRDLPLFHLAFPKLSSSDTNVSPDDVKSARKDFRDAMKPKQFIDYIDFLEIQNFRRVTNVKISSTTTPEESRPFSQTQAYRFFTENASIFHLAYHPSSILDVLNSALHYLVMHGSNKAIVVEVENSLIEIVRQAQEKRSKINSYQVPRMDLEYFGDFPYSKLFRFDQTAILHNFFRMQVTLNILPRLKQELTDWLKIIDPELVKLRERMDSFFSSDPADHSERAFVENLIQIERILIEKLSEDYSEVTASETFGQSNLQEIWISNDGPTTSASTPPLSETVTTLLNVADMSLIDTARIKGDYALIQRVMQLSGDEAQLESEFLTQLTEHAVLYMKKHHEVNELGPLTGLNKGLHRALEILKTQGHISEPRVGGVVDLSLEAEANSGNKSGPVYWAARFAKQALSLHANGLLSMEDQNLLRVNVPLPVNLIDLVIHKKEEALGAVLQNIGSDQLAHQDFLTIISAFGSLVIQKVDTYAKTWEDTGTEFFATFDYSARTIARASTDMIKIRDNLAQMDDPIRVWKKIEYEMVKRTTHFRQLNNKSLLTMEDMGLIYAYLVMHPSPMVACEYLAENFNTDLGALLVKIRLSLESFKDVLGYVESNLRSGKLTGLIRSLNPWNTPEYEGVSSLAEEALKNFATQTGWQQSLEGEETWEKPLFGLFEAHALIPTLFGMVEGEAVSDATRRLAAKLLRNDPKKNKYWNHHLVVATLGVVGKKKDKDRNKSKGPDEESVAMSQDKAPNKSPKQPTLSTFEKILAAFINGSSLIPKDERELLKKIREIEISRLLPVFAELSRSPNTDSETNRRGLILKVLQNTVHLLLVDHRILVRGLIPDLMKSLSLSELASLKLDSQQKRIVKNHSQSKKETEFAAELLFDTQLEKSQKRRDLYFEVIETIFEKARQVEEQEIDAFLSDFLQSMLVRNHQSVRTIRLYLSALKNNLISESFFYQHLTQYLAVPKRSLADYEVEFFLSCNQLFLSSEFSDLEWTLEDLGWELDSKGSGQNLGKVLRKDRELRTHDSIQRGILDGFANDGLDEETRHELNTITDAKGMRAVEIFARAHRFLLQDVSDVFKMGYDFVLINAQTGLKHHVELKTSALDGAKVHLSPNQIRVSDRHLSNSIDQSRVEYSVLVVKAGNFQEGGIHEFVWCHSPYLMEGLDPMKIPVDGVSYSLVNLEDRSHSVDRFRFK